MNRRTRATLAFALLSFGMSGESRTQVAECEDEYEQLVLRFGDAAGTRRPAEADVSPLLPQCPAHAGLRAMMAMIVLAEGRNEEAFRYADDAVRLDDKSALALHAKGLVLSTTGSLGDALALIERSIALDPNNQSFLLNYCSTLEAMKRYEDAIQACTKVLALDEAVGPPYFIRARAFEGKGDTARASEDFERAKAHGVDWGARGGARR